MLVQQCIREPLNLGRLHGISLTSSLELELRPHQPTSIESLATRLRLFRVETWTFHPCLMLIGDPFVDPTSTTLAAPVDSAVTADFVNRMKFLDGEEGDHPRDAQELGLGRGETTRGGRRGWRKAIPNRGGSLRL